MTEHASTAAWQELLATIGELDRSFLEGDRAVARHDGVANFGIRPMYQVNVPLMETHLFDFDGDLYGKYLSVELIAYIRPEAKFPNLDALIAQIAADVTAQMGHPLPGPAAQTHDEADPGSAAAADPAESVSDDGMNFVIVKRDVEVSVNNRFVDPARAQALVAAIAAKI